MLEYFSWSYLVLGSIFVVGITEYVKKNFMKGKPVLEKLIVAVPFVLSFGAGFLMVIVNGFNLWRFLFLSLTTLGFSTIGYESIVRLVNKKVKEIEDNTE